jgi:mannosyltransferase
MATREQRGIGEYASGRLSAARELASRHALLLIVALAAVVRFATLGTQSFWLDEYLTVIHTQTSFGETLNALPTGEVNPPLYFVLAWVWQKVFGGGEMALRSLSALLGTATIPVVYAAARELASRRAGLFAAGLAATNPLLIWYSQDVRAYPLLILLSALSFLFFVRALQREEPRSLWAWAAASGLALATHYFALMLLVPEAIWLLLRARAGRAKAFLACAGVGAVGLALLPLWLDQHGRATWIAQLSASDRLLAVPQHFVVGLSVPWRALSVVVTCVLVVALLYALRRADQPVRRAFAIPGGVAAAGMLFAAIAMLLGNDYLITRNVIELWLPFGVAVAVALGARAAGGVGPAVVVGLCVIGLALSIWNAATPEARRLNWDQVARDLGEPRRQRVVVGPGVYVGVPLSLYVDSGHLAKVGERIVASELVLVSLRQVQNYGIGPCFWGAVCGGDGLGGSGPPFQAPPQFKLVRQGSTPRVTYRIYRAARPVRLPAPEPAQIVVVQEPG